MKSEKEELLRRLEDFCQYAKATKKFHDLDLYEKLIKFIEKCLSGEIGKRAVLKSLF